MVTFFKFLKNHLQTLLGWLAGACGFIVYYLTTAPTVTFWDCGEFISTVHGLQIGHAPGAPVYQLLCKVFSLLAGKDVVQIARMVNLFSAFCSGLTLVFLYWTLVWLIKKHTNSSFVITLGAWVGTLTFAFTDSWWNISTEAEVYALAMLCSSTMLWIATRWETSAKEKAARWVVLLAFATGLSMGIHWLCLLVLPAILLIFYFKQHNPTSWGVLLVIGVACLLVLAILWAFPLGILPMIQFLELFFVNKLHFPIGLAGIALLVLLYTLLVFGAVVSGCLRRKIWHVLLWSGVFLCLGYSFYLIPVIRSQAGVPLNQGNPSNFFSLQQYLNRNQYEKAPLLYGPCYTATPAVAFKDGNFRYSPEYVLYNGDNEEVARERNKAKVEEKMKGCTSARIDEHYVVIDSAKHVIPDYDERLCMLFPRMWSAQNPLHEYGYVNWVGEPEDIVFINDEDIRPKPSFKQNMQFFVNYQLNYMYWRYFLWNFAGKFNDAQGFSFEQDGAWVSGFPILDDYLIGDAKNLPRFRESAAHNTYFFLPLLLGIIGLFYHLQKHTSSLLWIFFLFLFTGMAVVIYVNQYAYQPRERDYSYILSFYAFSLWIGVGAAAIIKSFVKRFRKIWGGLFGGILCFSVPMLLLAENYHDHDRSENYTARNFAIAILESCEPNAILFTNGDNDTYPLWYMQQVEGFRRDVRVVNIALLNADWYIDQLTMPHLNAAPLSLSIAPKQYTEAAYNVSYIKGGTLRMNLAEALDSLYNEAGVINIDDNKYHYLPTNHMKLAIKSDMQGEEKDTVRWSLEDYALAKNDMMVLEIIARNAEKHPIYFSTYSIQNPVGLKEYLLQTGLACKLAYRQVDDKPAGTTMKIDTETMYENILYKFSWQGFSGQNAYHSAYDKEIVSHFRQSVNLLAEALNAKKEFGKAISILDFVMDTLNLKNIPIDRSIENIAYAYGTAGDFEAAHALFDSLLIYTEQDIRYLVNLRGHYKKNARLQLVNDYHRLLNMAAFAENRRMEADRITISERIFRLNNIYHSYIQFVLEDLCRTPDRTQYFAEDIGMILDLVLRISDFCDAYDERLQSQRFYATYEKYSQLIED